MAKQTKAEKVREILRARGKKTDEQVLELVMKVGLTRSLAKVYIANNQKRLKEGAPQKPKAAKTTSKKGAQQKQVKEQPAAQQ